MKIKKENPIYLFLQAEEDPVVIEDGGSLAPDQFDGGVDVAGLDEPPDLEDEEAGAIARGGRRRRIF